MPQKHRWFRRAFFFAVSLYPAVLAADPSNAVVDPPEAASNTFSARTLQLDPVVVTANRLDTPADRVSSSMSVVTAGDLDRTQARTALDALQTVPGISLTRTGGPGGIASLYTRGGNDDATLVMLDGIPLNDPVGTSRSYNYLDQLSLDGIRQVEVVRGPQGALYGSAAMAGVVNLLTRDGQGPLGGSLRFEGGSYGTFEERAMAQGGDAGGSFLLSASRFDTAGFPTADQADGNRIDSPDQDTSGLLKIGALAAPNLRTEWLARYSQSRTNLADLGGPGGEDPNYFADQKQLALDGRAKWEMGPWEQFFSASFCDDNRVYTDRLDAAYPYSADQKGDYDGQSAQIGWQNNLTVSPQETLVLGLQGEGEWGLSRYRSATYSYSDDASGAARMGSAYVSSQTHLEGRWFLNLGARVDAHSQFGTHGTWQAGTAYFIPGPQTKLSANVGTGFQAPDLYQLYDPSYGNPALQPETNTGFDLGVEQPLGPVRVGATFFHDDYGNLFGADSSTFRYINVARARTQGVESFVELEGVRRLRVKAAYTYLDTRDLSTDAGDLDAGRELLRRPAHQGVLDADYDFGPWQAGGSLRYVGARLDEDFSAYRLVTLPSYLLVGLRGSFQLDGRWTLFARVDNLFDESYEEILGFGTPGRSFYGGVKVSL